MSAIAGECRIDGAPADAGLLSRMSARLAHRGPDGQGQWVDGPVGLGHRLHATTAEALADKQPVGDETGERWLVWDGRLDNRGELVAALGGGDATDAALALAAYGHWGPGFVAQLVGDFALVLWDARERALLCARDVFGVKPLYYHWDGRRLLFASEIAALFADAAVPRRPDESVIADVLLTPFRDAGATFFETISQVPPAHRLRLDARGVRLERYWDADAAPARRPRADGEYLDEFRVLFTEAVRCRLRAPAPVALMLSGGIDSVTVAATAAALRRDTGGDLAAFTMVTDGFLQEDCAAIDGLEATYGMRTQWLPHTAAGSWLEASLSNAETPSYDGLVHAPAHAVLARGCRVVLSGFGADELSGAAERGYLEDVLVRSPWRVPAEARRHLDAYGHDGVGWHRELAWRAWARLPPRWRHTVKVAAGRRVPSWIEPAFARRARLGERVVAAPARRFAARSAQATWEALTGPTMVFALDQLDGTAASASLERRYPYLDRRLVEFFLAVPAAVKMRDGHRKRFVQRALAPVVGAPPRARETSDFAVPPLDHATNARREAAALSRLSAPGARITRYVRRSVIAGRLHAYLTRGAPYGYTLWHWLALEAWLQRSFPDGREGPAT
ncbi:MAG TPA: asparagine synthase-related protein [Candidatus Limnocylindria bacterium]|nr:asparagine synthase-related protein [Candidatus Limnocylindria bacterium]